MTDRQFDEWYIRHAERERPEDRIETNERILKEREEEQKKKPIGQQKAEYWEFCREFGLKDQQIQNEWDKYLKKMGLK